MVVVGRWRVGNGARDAPRGNGEAPGNELLRQFSLKAIEADPNAQFGYIGMAWSLSQ